MSQTDWQKGLSTFKTLLHSKEQQVLVIALPQAV